MIQGELSCFIRSVKRSNLIRESINLLITEKERNSACTGQAESGKTITLMNRRQTNFCRGNMRTGKVEVGYQFGEFTVVAPTEKKKNGYKVWICQCSCGEKVEMDTRKIQRGTQLDCGHNARKELVGKVFGKLTIKEVVLKNGKVFCKCQCECGKETFVSYNDLKSGRVKSCGCGYHTNGWDLTGQTFGKLTVLGYAGKFKGTHRWTCACSCGNTCEVSQTSLLSGKTRSCGCLRAETLEQSLKRSQGTSVTLIEARKKKTIKSNRSGYNGVYLNRASKKWIAQITFQSKTYYLGSYETLAQAVAARKEGEVMHDQFLEWYYARNNKTL